MSTLGMRKPRRKHPGFHIAAESTQGLRFFDELDEALGGPFIYTPAGYLARTKMHVFTLEGPSRTGLLSLREWIEDGECVAVYTVCYSRGATEGLWVVQLVTFRVDRSVAWEHGVYAPPGLSKAAERRWWDEQRRALGERKDRCMHTFHAESERVLNRHGTLEF